MGRSKYVPDFIAKRARRLAGVTYDKPAPVSDLNSQAALMQSMGADPKAPFVDPPNALPRTKVRIRTDPAFLAGVLDRLRNNQNTERVSVSRIVIDAAIEELKRLAEIDAKAGQ